MTRTSTVEPKLGTGRRPGSQRPLRGRRRAGRSDGLNSFVLWFYRNTSFRRAAAAGAGPNSASVSASAARAGQAPTGRVASSACSPSLASPESLDYVQNKTQFQLHTLLTEQRHPKTWNLGERICRDTADGLRMLLSVDEDIAVRLRTLASDSAALESLVAASSGRSSPGRRSTSTAAAPPGVWPSRWRAPSGGRSGGVKADAENLAEAPGARLARRR